MNIQNKLPFYLILFVYLLEKFFILHNHILMYQEIYKKGGRKFAIPNLVPLGCLPFARALNPDTGACFQEITALAKLHNEALSQVLQKLESQLHGFKYSIADSYSSLSERINNPSKYGMSRLFSCCRMYFTIVIIWYFISIKN